MSAQPDSPPKPPTKPLGLWHVALNVVDLDAVERFYVDLLGFEVEWRPDPDNVYLTSGRDNLAIHRVAGPLATHQASPLDHVGLMLAQADDVDVWHAHLTKHGVEIRTEPRTHRDGARSFYCVDPAGNGVQIIHHPPVVSAKT